MKITAILLFIGALLLFQQSYAEDCFNLHLKAKKSPHLETLDADEHSVSISLNQNTKIYLQEGPFSVLDRNGTDGLAMISLPKPDPGNMGTTGYSAFMRLVGKPGSRIHLQTCMNHSVGGLFCSREPLDLTRITGSPQTANASKEMLYIYDFIYGFGVLDRVPLFSGWEHGYHWIIQASEKLHAQLQFCLVPTKVR